MHERQREGGNTTEAVHCRAPTHHSEAAGGATPTLHDPKVLQHLGAAELRSGDCSHGRRKPGVAASDSRLVAVYLEAHLLHSIDGGRLLQSPS